MIVNLLDEEGNEISVEFPEKWEICDNCNGDGHHCKHLGAYTSSEFEEQFDYEERERYFAGGYDKTCEECNGSGKIKVVDVENLNSQQIEDYKLYQDQEERKAKYDREEAYIRKMESGGW